MMKKTLKYGLVIFLAILTIALISFIIWAETPAGPTSEAVNALQNDPKVLVSQNPWYIFEPVSGSPTSGVIFYPGGRVDPRSYAPLARALAENGHLAIIVPMPLNLAVFSPNRATEIISTFPEIDDWVISGHSLGGAMAANFVYQNPTAVNGLALLAAYPASNNDLSNRDISVVSIFGTNDGLADLETIQNSRSLLPVDTRWVEIPGGNHAQFGWYGDQSGDNPATISHEDQQTITVQAILDLLNEIQNQ